MGGIGRVAALGALVLAIIAVAFILFGGGDSGNKYRLLFETGGQLVKDNQVLIGGSPGRHRRRRSSSPTTARPRSGSPSTSSSTRAPPR